MRRHHENYDTKHKRRLLQSGSLRVCFVSDCSGRLRIFPPHLALGIPLEASASQEVLFRLGIAGGHDAYLSVSGGDLLVGDAVELGELGWLWSAG